MIHEGFKEYLFGIYGHKSGAYGSYVIAMRIIDQMLEKDDIFGLKGSSVTFVDNYERLDEIVHFVRRHLDLYKKGKSSIFSNIDSRQTSYALGGFCSAVINRLLEYQEQVQNQAADSFISGLKTGRKISKSLIDYFDIGEKGIDTVISAKGRLGQSYFRKMVLANYDNKCCVTGLNVPETLRASHIAAWADDTKNRMNPENGLCLSATYDAAFDKHLISFDEDYRMIVSREIKEYYTNEVTREYFEQFEGKQILMPLRFKPSQTLLAKHREQLVG